MAQKAKKADVVAATLRREIVHGSPSVGKVLPREQDLAQRFDVNRSVVREAVRQLEAQRLVRPIKRRGTEVLDPLASPSPDVLHAMLSSSPGTIDTAVLADLLDVRATLDIEMTTLAAQRRTDDDLQRMFMLTEELATQLGNPIGYASTVDQLALAFAAATQNRIYQMLVHWHMRVRGDVEALYAVIKIANQQHLDGIGFLVDLIRAQDTTQTRNFMTLVHQWVKPRIMAAAALSNGDPLP